MPLVCVDGAEVSIAVKGPQVLAVTTDNIPSSTSNTFTVGGKSVLLEADIADWLAGFTTDYDNAAFSGGSAGGDAISGVADLTVDSISTDGMANMATVVSATLAVSSPANGPNGSKDPVGTINIEVTFTDAAQTQLTAAV